MNRYKWIGILILTISIVCITSACNKLNVNQSKGNNSAITDTKSIDPISTNNTPLITSDNKDHVNSDVNVKEVSKENAIKSKIMDSDKKQLKKEDFKVSYKNIIINENTKVDDIITKLGFPEDYEANNQGYISGNSNYRRWNLCYPNYSEPEIRIIVLSEREYVGEEVIDGYSYIVGIYLESYSTNQGLKVGDTLEKVLQLYGRPDSFEKDEDNVDGLYILRYSKGDLNLDITLDKDLKKVEYVFIDYNMNKSIEEQQNTKN